MDSNSIPPYCSSRVGMLEVLRKDSDFLSCKPMGGLLGTWDSSTWSKQTSPSIAVSWYVGTNLGGWYQDCADIPAHGIGTTTRK